jgi:pilus assembly protein CpaC
MKSITAHILSRPYFKTDFLAILIWVLLPTSAMAQSEDSAWLDIELGKSLILETASDPTTIAVTDATICIAQTMGNARKIQVQGLEIGNTDLVIQFGDHGNDLTYDVVVHRDLSDLIRTIDTITEGTPPSVYPLEDRIVIQGPVDDLDTLEQVAQMTQIFDPQFVNLMTVRGDHQVQLEVVFAEISRSGSRELGLNVLWGNAKKSIGIGTESASASLVGNLLPELAGQLAPGIETPAPAAGLFQVAGFVSQINLGAILGIIQEYKLGRILAKPTLVTLSGQSGSFMAGGEVPIQTTQGLGSVSTEFKPYGVQMDFVPTVLAGNVVDLVVNITVSEIDQGTGSNGVAGMLSRQGSSHLRITSGMTFAMAGMINEHINYVRSGAPGLSKIPVLGALFRTVRHVRTETEVVIFVTPRLVRPLAAGEIPAYPGTTENNNPGDMELFLLGLDRQPRSRSAKPTAKIGLRR